MSALHPLLNFVPLDGGTGELIMLLVLLTLAGLGLIYDGFVNFRRRRLIEDTPTSTINSLAMGPVELEGTVEPADGTLAAPFDDDDAVLVKYKIERPDDDGGWDTVKSGIRAHPFYIDDGSGKVLVDVTGIQSEHLDMEFDGDDYEVKRVIKHDGSGDQMPDSLERFRGKVGLDERPDGLIGKTKRRYKQETIRPGDDLFVFGAATFPDSPDVGEDGLFSATWPGVDDVTSRLHELADRDAVEAIFYNGSESPVFFLANQDEDHLIDERRWSLAWKLPVGALLSAGSFVALLALFGLI